MMGQLLNEVVYSTKQTKRYRIQLSEIHIINVVALENEVGS